ncbi:MAG: hypothetical protein JJ974_12265 [Phycisphaerales bacterium]|nr:hypothetical protein [Phycisphaerales bacterium]
MTESVNHQEGTHEASERAGVHPLWKYCSFVLGFGLILAIGGNSGPASAVAGEQSGGRDGGVLSVGGFGAVGDEPGLVIYNQRGERVGTLPMSAHAGD